MQQQQIQALLANVEKLTHQNEELQKTMESQNVKCRRIGENQNEEESNSQANRRENLDGMTRRTDSPFTNEVLNHHLPPKFCLLQLESYDGSKDRLDHIK